MIDMWSLQTRELFQVLFHLPDVVGFKQLLEVVILLLSRYLSKLSVNGIIIGRSLNIADNTECDGESILRSHHGKLELQGVVLAVSIVYQYIVDGVTILTDLNNLQTEALLYQSELIVLAEYQLLAVLYVDGVLLTALVVINNIMAVVVEDYTVLQNLGYTCTLVLVSSLQNL